MRFVGAYWDKNQLGGNFCAKFALKSVFLNFFKKKLPRGYPPWGHPGGVKVKILTKKYEFWLNFISEPPPMFSNAIKNSFFAKPLQRSSNAIAYPPSISSSRVVGGVKNPKKRQNPTFGAILGHLYPLYPPKFPKNTSIYTAMHVHIGCEQFSRK